MSVSAHLTISTEARYGVVAGLLALAITVTMVASPARWALIVVSACEGAALMVARAAIRTAAVLTIAVTIAALLSVVLASLPYDSARLAAAIVDGMLLMSIPVAIGLRVRQSFYVNVQTILAAISVYLVLGLFFAVFDSILSLLTGARFFAQLADANSGQYTYFSFITLCTVGYGDLTPGSAMARAMAVTEALIGQLYLVTVIAVVVANLGRPRQRSSSP